MDSLSYLFTRLRQTPKTPGNTGTSPNYLLAEETSIVQGVMAKMMLQCQGTKDAPNKCQLFLQLGEESISFPVAPKDVHSSSQCDLQEWLQRMSSPIEKSER